MKIPTWIEVGYPTSRGPIGLRGSLPPLSWEATTEPLRIVGDDHLFCVALDEGDLLEVKVVRGEDWAVGRNYVVHAGEHLRIEPSFEGTKPNFVRDVVIEHGGRSARVDVLLPPSYEEQPSKRYPVLYVLDGQSLWAHSQDPFGTWAMDSTLSFLYELGAIEELIVVGIHTAEDRLEILSPVADAQYGGGKGPELLRLIVDGVRPRINTDYRTILDHASTGILGSSMGGLFAFYAAWSRPEIFGKAGCLSSSFWWNDRWMVRQVHASTAPHPHPSFYLDTGASPSTLNEDVRLVDGFHHTRSMLRALARSGFDVGNQVQRLVFPGEAHQAAAWASRVALPLQLLFPYTAREITHSRWGDLIHGDIPESLAGTIPKAS